MKRSAGDGAGNPPKRPSRQDPVSCDFCRKKKLKCDRALPCSSCRVRKLSCCYGALPLGARASTEPSQTEERHVDDGILAQNARWNPRQSMETQIRGDNEPLQTVDWLETIVMGPRIPSAMPDTLRAELSHRGNEASPSQSSASGESATLFGRGIASRENPATVHLPSYLPPLAEALGLFQYYCRYLDFQYHLIIPTQTEEQIKGIYVSAMHDTSINLAHAALLFSIASAALYYKLLRDAPDYAEQISREATFLSGAALIQASHVSYPTIEGLQATMLIGHQLSNMNLPPSVSSLFLPRSSVSQAISLRLHLIDSPQFANERILIQSENQSVELKRRLWWDLVAYDWLIGFLSGPQEWTYSIQPQHMIVNEPLNLEDDEINKTQGHPMSTPTAMSYPLCRLKLAVMCRQIVDETSHYHLRGQEVPYEITLALDRKLQEILSEIPTFFRFDQSSRRQHAQLYQDRPTFVWQRAMVQQGYHSRFCRLHRGYFVRGAKDPRYSYSHVVSLQSARRVLETKRMMDEEGPVFTPHSSVVWSVMHHVFMAASILLIDVCFNWDDILAEKRRAEVLDACRMLGRAQQSSPSAREGINAMMAILRKHWRHEKRPGSRSREDYSITSSNAVSQVSRSDLMTPVSLSTGSTTLLQRPDGQSTLDPSAVLPSDPPLEDLWAEFIDGGAHAELDTPDWTVLLNELTNVALPNE
ncbi:unnamed protein product [Penicillium olsonii]|nr:unnamed protein product [Penicillium olsonii]CAG7922152.1 unnamed protein product [Penicillium olsonii]